MMNDEGRLSPAMDELDAWTEAENAALDYLCEVTGHKVGVNAFLGQMDVVCNSFCLYNQPVSKGGRVFYAPSQPSFVLPYRATATFDNRRDLQRWMMKVVRGLPLLNRGSIAQLRLDEQAFGTLRTVSLLFLGESEERLAYQLDANFDLVVRVK